MARDLAELRFSYNKYFRPQSQRVFLRMVLKYSAVYLCKVNILNSSF